MSGLTMKPFISSLPDEILTRIFEYLREDKRVYEKELSFVDSTKGSSDYIKHVRLACRRFHETSSHLLLGYIPVCLTRQSLAHLDKVSRHPLLSKGVRAIKLNLIPFYDAVLARYIQPFAAYRAANMLESVEAWECIRHLKFSAEDIKKAKSLAESWEEVAAHGINPTDVDHIPLTRAHEAYNQRYREHKDLCGFLAHDIAAAMMRMPKASWLAANDFSKGQQKYGGRPRSFFLPKDLNSPDSLQESLLAPVGQISGWGEAHDDGLGAPPFNLISDLLFSIQQLGVTLRGFDLATSPPADGDSFAHAGQEGSGLRNVARQLKAVKFCPRDNLSWETWANRPADKWTPFINFLADLLHTKSLQKIDLSFYFILKKYRRPLLSMAPLLLSYTWPELKILHFNGPFHLEELKSVVKRLDKLVELHWNGYLMSGSWAEVLDFVRDQKLKSVQVNHTNGSIYGGEIYQMSATERMTIFSEVDIDRVRDLATLYVQGLRKSNPVRDWENGMLESEEEIN